MPALGDAVLARSEDPRAAHVKLIRTIRLDPSDTFVFERAAEPGEWAVSGAFVFWNADVAKLEGKARSAFRGGVPRRRVARLVDAGADRRGERSGSRRAGRAAGAATRRAFRRAGYRGGPRGGRGRSRVRRVAVQSPGRYADRGASHFRRRRGARSVPHAASARRQEADAGVLVPRSRGRGGAGATRSISSRMAGEQERSAR